MRSKEKNASEERRELSDQQVDLKVAIAVIQNTVTDIKGDVSEIKKKLEADYVTKQEFDPVKKVVYGLVSLVLTAVVGALIILVIRK